MFKTNMEKIFRFYSKPHNSVRVTVVGNYSNEMLNIAVARCSAKDQFIRKKGRIIAEGRLKKSKFYFSIKIKDKSYLDNQKFINFASVIAKVVAENNIYNANSSIFSF